MLGWLTQFMLEYKFQLQAQHEVLELDLHYRPN